MFKGIFFFVSIGITYFSVAQNVIINGSNYRIKPLNYVNDYGANSVSQTSIFNDVALSGFDVFNANINFSDKDDVQKIGFSPLRLSKDYYGVFSNLKFNVANKSTQFTSGLSIGYDNSALETKYTQDKLNKFTRSVGNISILPPRDANETIAAYTERIKHLNYSKELDSLVEKFEDERQRSVFKTSIGYNAQFFNILNTSSTNNDFDSLNYYGFKGHHIFYTASYSFKRGCFSVEGTLNYYNKRKSADSSQLKNDYVGFSIGITKRIVRLIGEDELKTKEFYLKSQFIPSIYLGFAFEQFNYLGRDGKYAEDENKSQSAYTPYLDVCVTPAIQFRLSFPIKNTVDYVTGNREQKVITMLSFNYKLVNLGE